MTAYRVTLAVLGVVEVEVTADHPDDAYDRARDIAADQVRAADDALAALGSPVGLLDVDYVDVEAVTP